MTILTSYDSASPNSPLAPELEQAAGNLTGLSLRVLQPGADEKILPITMGKCTVGSSDRCQIPLASGQARPLHCLIVHEGATTTVTRWAPGALLNGQEFATSPFLPGDCLQIGEVQLVLLAETHEQQQQTTQQSAPPAVSTVSNAFASLPPVGEETSIASPTQHLEKAAQQPTPNSRETNESPASKVSAANQLEADRLVRRLWTANYGARQRCRQLVGSLRTMRTRSQGFDQQVDELQLQLRSAIEEREQIFEQLSNLQADAVQRENQSSEEIDRLISELTAAYEKSSTAEAAVFEQAEQAGKLQTELASLQGQREQWEQIRSAGDLQRTKLAQALADHEQCIESLEGELEQTRGLANQAEASREEQASALAHLKEELKQAQIEREQLAEEQVQSQQYQQEIEQALADSEQNLAVFQLELEKFQLTSRQSGQELSEANAGFENLQVEFVQLSEERDQLVTKHTEYQLREQGWEHELSSRDKQIETLTNEVTQLRTSIAETGQGVAEQVAQVENFQQQLDSLTLERDQLLVAQAEQLEKIQEWEEVVSTRDHRILELEEEHAGICQVLQSVEKGSFEQVDFCNKLEKQLAALRSERDQLATTLPELQEYCKQLEQALAERDGQITLLSEELTKTTQRQSELEIELAAGTNAHQSLEAEFVELNTRCEQLVAEQNSSDQGKADVEQTLTQYQGLIEELQEQIEAAKQQRQELEQAVAEGSQANEAYQNELNQLQVHYEQLSTEHRAETDRRHDLDQQLVEGQNNIELFQVDLKSKQAELDNTVEQVSNLQTERQTLTQQLAGLREDLVTQEEGETSADQLRLQEREKFASELAVLQQELETVRLQADVACEDTGVSKELLITQFEEEKSLLLKQADQQGQQTQQLVDELQDTRSQFTAGQSELEQLTQLYQQSQSELEQAQQGLLMAEQALQERASSLETVEKSDLADNEFHGETKNVVESKHVSLDPDFEQGVEETQTSDLEVGFLDEVAVNSESAEEAKPSRAELAPFDETDAETEETVEEFQPPSFIDQYQHLLEEDDQAILDAGKPEPGPVVNKLAAEIDSLKMASQEESDEADLEAYMSNMLRRMRGENSEEETLPPQANGPALKQNPNPVTAVDNVLDRATACEQSIAEEPLDSEPLDLEMLKHSSRKPSLPTDISAMRELANSSARRAIAKHHKRRHLEKAFGLFLVCLISVGVGGYLMLIAAETEEFLSLNFLGGAVGALAGVFGGFKLLGLLMLAIREGAWEKKKTAKPSSKQAQ